MQVLLVNIYVYININVSERIGLDWGSGVWLSSAAPTWGSPGDRPVTALIALAYNIKWLRHGLLQSRWGALAQGDVLAHARHPLASQKRWRLLWVLPSRGSSVAWRTILKKWLRRRYTLSGSSWRQSSMPSWPLLLHAKKMIWRCFTTGLPIWRGSLMSRTGRLMWGWCFASPGFQCTSSSVDGDWFHRVFNSRMYWFGGERAWPPATCSVQTIWLTALFRQSSGGWHGCAYFQD